jgi:membrane-associated progesterone receptor component
MSDTGHVPEPKNFAPKTPVQLNAPKDDPITSEELSKCDGTEDDYDVERTLTRRLTGTDPNRPTLVAIKGTVFDVSGNEAYGAKGQYHGQ